MPKKVYKTIMVNEQLYQALDELATKIARNEGVTKITRPVLLEKMMKTFKETYADSLR